MPSTIRDLIRDSVIGRAMFGASALAKPCWIWAGRRGGKGYGQVNRHDYAHRVMWEEFRGPIPAGMELDHICRQRGCVNPWHLRVVTARENAFAPGAKGLAPKMAAKTHCPKGHPYDMANTSVGGCRGGKKVGVRTCRACARERIASRRVREKEMPCQRFVI